MTAGGAGTEGISAPPDAAGEVDRDKLTEKKEDDDEMTAVQNVGAEKDTKDEEAEQQQHGEQEDEEGEDEEKEVDDEEEDSDGGEHDGNALRMRPAAASGDSAVAAGAEADEWCGHRENFKLPDGTAIQLLGAQDN